MQTPAPGFRKSLREIGRGLFSAAKAVRAIIIARKGIEEIKSVPCGILHDRLRPF